MIFVQVFPTLFDLISTQHPCQADSGGLGEGVLLTGDHAGKSTKRERAGDKVWVINGRVCDSYHRHLCPEP